MTRKLICPFLFLILTVFGVSAWGAPMADFTYVETDLGGGLWQYDYTVTNTSDPMLDAGFNLYDVFFLFDPAITATVVSFPTDWDGIDGFGFAEAFSLVPGAFPFGADIAPGSSLDGFLFEFDGRVGDVLFEATFEDPSDPFNPFIYEGISSAVPEPASILLLGTGLGLVGLVALRRKRR